MDSLLSIVQMPAGVPVATVSVGGARNAGLLAVRILAAADPALRERMGDVPARPRREGQGQGRGAAPQARRRRRLRRLTAGADLALLRGINLGRHRVAMADLAALLERLGYTGVRTHLQSGNAGVHDAEAARAPSTVSGGGDRVRALRLRRPRRRAHAAQLAAVRRRGPVG